MYDESHKIKGIGKMWEPAGLIFDRGNPQR
jgi:hypothetical protein